MEVDYIIAGGGLCGMLLGEQLIRAGRSILVVDDGGVCAASRVAGGIVNPVTGMRLVRSWMIEQLLPFALDTYRRLGQELEVPIVQECRILDFFASREQQAIFAAKATEEREYLAVANNDEGWGQYFRFNYGIGVIEHCLLVDIHALLNGLAMSFREQGCIAEERFKWADCIVADGHVHYKNIKACKIICCEGAEGDDNPYFKMLPWSKDKGEAIIVSIPGLPRNCIYKQGTSIVPWQDGLFWVGASHDWKYSVRGTTAAFRKSAEEQLDYWLQLPYTIMDHIAARRPANVERRPFVGLHPNYPCISILNGMGGKGVSMAPYFAHELAMHLVHGAPLLPEADVRRFRRVLDNG